MKIFQREINPNLSLSKDGLGTPVSSRLPTSKNLSLKGLLPKLILALAILAVLAIVVRFAFNAFQQSTRPTADSRVSISGPKKTLALNKEFNFPVKDASGKEVTKMKYTITNAELRDEIIVQGQKRVTVKGQTFLVLSIKLTNSYDKAIDFYTRDYLRLFVNGNRSELFAANIHNDPVTVQGISTQDTRLGFPINDSDKNLVLLVGDNKNFSTEIPLNFK